MKLTTVGMNKKQYFDALRQQANVFRVAYNTPDGRIGKWKYSNELEEYNVDYRAILPNESVIDIDTDDYNQAAILANKIRRALVSANIPYIMAWSGGKGFHFHTFFDPKTLGVFVEITGSVKSAKRFLMVILLGYAGVWKKEMRSIIDPRKLSPNEDSSLIREFGGWKMGTNRKGRPIKIAKKRVITHVPSRPKDLLGMPVLRPRYIKLMDAEARLQQIVLMTEWVRLNNKDMFKLAAEEIKHKLDCQNCNLKIPEMNVMYPSDVCYLCSMKHNCEGTFVVEEGMELKKWVEMVGYDLATKELNTKTNKEEDTKR